MTRRRLVRWTAPALFLCLSLSLPAAGSAGADAKWDPQRTTVPETVEELKALQETVSKVTDKCIPYTVGIRIGLSAGSGVIVSEDGLVLTAGHVSGEPDRDCWLILPDGKEVKGKTLGQNKKMDSGMIRITGKGPNDGAWPFAKIAKSADLKKGQWVVSLGHPNGYKKGRPPVARLGQIKNIVDKGPGNVQTFNLCTNCTLVGGDSGGPLFDLEGQLIGIHSQIGPSINTNLHVPVDAYKTDWDQLVKGEKIEPGKPAKAAVVIGVVFPEDDSEPAKLEKLEEGGPAAAAGLLAGDVITKFDGKPVESVKELRDLMKKYKPDDEIEVTVKRGTKTVTYTVTLGKRTP
ncbi:MAG TPA: S1C family serine protease [Gemmataceae bacterium]|nr:S1C family serine protease [Gemmataceae bacterium]